MCHSTNQESIELAYTAVNIMGLHYINNSKEKSHGTKSRHNTMRFLSNWEIHGIEM